MSEGIMKFRITGRTLFFLCALLICGYFLALAGAGLSAGFTTDDLVNLTAYWKQSPATLVKENILYFSPAYRPMGALFYRPTFALCDGLVQNRIIHTHPNEFRTHAIIRVYSRSCAALIKIDESAPKREICPIPGLNASHNTKIASSSSSHW